MDFGCNPGTSQTIGRHGSFSEQVAITHVNTKTSLTDFEIQTELVNQIKGRTCTGAQRSGSDWDSLLPCYSGLIGLITS
jgi:hypothetical protein